MQITLTCDRIASFGALKKVDYGGISKDLGREGGVSFRILEGVESD